jgi:hypothetical protein
MHVLLDRNQISRNAAKSVSLHWLKAPNGELLTWECLFASSFTRSWGVNTYLTLIDELQSFCSGARDYSTALLSCIEYA